MNAEQLHTPCYVIDRDRLEENLKVLRGVMDRTGCRILLAQKAFSCYAVYPLISQYLCGATASGLFEARLCHEEMPGRENHIFSPAFREEDMPEILSICDHIVFNSIRQLELFGARAKKAGLQVGLRINPQISTQPAEHAIYDPCAKGSRLGVTLDEFREAIDSGKPVLGLLDGLHFHTLCEQNSDDLETTLNGFEGQFREWLPQMKWVNFGGGHHITRADYDIPRLERCINRMSQGYGLMVYLEPGEAIALNAGYLHTQVLEVQHHAGAMDIAILDTSAACHMPDVLEMPYRPPLRDSGQPAEKAYTYRLGGPTCLSGDIIGEYSFDTPLKEGQTLIFEDMAIYSMVKNNTFNGMPLPSIYLKQGSDYTLIKSFSYADFKVRL
ncbi:MAG: carboxynorspermidine decarboxylase [Bacteroidaceae bacterium]|nr:carboxynorspermidine decarboxylase [Bacteroidaceae bacterium]